LFNKTFSGSKTKRETGFTYSEQLQTRDKEHITNKRNQQKNIFFNLQIKLQENTILKKA